MADRQDDRDEQVTPADERPDGGSPHWLKPQHDANARRLSEVLRDITRMVSDWVWEISPDLKFTYMSPRIFETLGFHPAELRGKTLLDIGTPINDEGESVAIDWYRPFRGQLFTAKNKLNDVRMIELSGVPVFDSGTGSFRGVRGTAIDTTERRRIERTLQLARDEAESANRHKTRSLFTLAEEIRGPLDVILSAARQISDVSTVNDLTRYRADILSAGNQLDRLVGGIHYLAQLETGQMEFAVEPIAPTSIVDECLEDVESMARERKIRILRAHHWDGNIAVDRRQFKQVLLNLIANGIRHNRIGGQLTIAASRDDPRRYRLCVTDEGTGLPARIGNELFHPFSLPQAKGNESGYGLELAITKRLVERMHGIIGISPAQREGATFWIEFPAIGKIA